MTVLQTLSVLAGMHSSLRTTDVCGLADAEKSEMPELLVPMLLASRLKSGILPECC